MVINFDLKSFKVKSLAAISRSHNSRSSSIEKFVNGLFFSQ